ncbi:MAG: hypothetical protein RL266_2604 [Bacteroidota bacterium]|jgi:predicted alpha/beta hydrolase
MTADPVAIVNADGSELTVQLYAADKPRAVCIVFPAMGVYAKYYQPLAVELAKNGLTTVTADLRGNDASSIRPRRGTDFSYTDLIHLDMHSVITEIRSRYEKVPLYLFGHSLGGQLSCLYASKHPQAVDGLILSATCSVYHKGWEGFGAYRILAGTQFANAVAATVGYFPGKKVGFGGTEARSVIADWSRQSRTGKYVLKNDDFNYENALRNLQKPVLAISYEGDSLSPKGAVEHLLGKMESAPKQHLHLLKTDERNDELNHFNWAKKPNSVVRIVSDWVAEQS